MQEEVVLVDSMDTIIGHMGKMEVHKQGALHRAFSIFIFNSKGVNCFYNKGMPENTIRRVYGLIPAAATRAPVTKYWLRRHGRCIKKWALQPSVYI